MNPGNQLISVQMILRHVMYISYLVPASRIRPLVPNVLPLATPFPDQVFVSIVGMKCNRVRLSGFPWPSFNYAQLNVRTYVIDPQTGNQAVYFFYSGVTSLLVPLLTHILAIPWEKGDGSFCGSGIRNHSHYRTLDRLHGVYGAYHTF